MELIERHCNGCNTTKPINEFSKDKYRKLGFSFKCKRCRAKQTRNWADKNPDKVKESNLKSKETRKEYYNSPERKLKYRIKFIEKSFKIKYEEYEKMQIEQNNLCFICNKPETSSKNTYLSVDHCHDTGKIRGLLCNSCNRALGYFKDSIELLKNAQIYLQTKN